MTLLEVLVAIAVFAVVYAIGVPSLQALRAPYALDSAASQVAAHLDLARQRAIMRNVRHRVVFSGSAYQIERENTPSSFVTDSAVYELPHGVELGAADPADPVFNSRGMIPADVTVPVTVAGVGTKTVTINVLGKTTID